MFDKDEAESVKKILKAHEEDAEKHIPAAKRKKVRPSMFMDEYIKTGNPIFKDAAHQSFKKMLNE